MIIAKVVRRRTGSDAIRDACDKDSAFKELDESFKKHDWFFNRLKVDPFMDPLRGDPRFDAMVNDLTCRNRR